MSEGIEGACLCGKIAFELRDAEMLGGCHCTRCQRWTGTGSAMVVVVGAKNFKVAKGAELMKVYNEAEFAPRHFCSNCGSSIYTDGGEKLYVGAGVLKGVTLKPAFHIQVAYKAAWDEIGGNAPQFPEWPPS